MPEAVQTPPAQLPRRMRRTRIGVVESDVRDKTIRVRLERLVKHAKYGKYTKWRTVLHAHDEKNEAKAGDTVRIVEARPMSRLKRWKLVEVLKRGEVIEKIGNEAGVSA